MGERAFSYAGPMAWNSLPAQLQTLSQLLFIKNSKQPCFSLVTFVLGRRTVYNCSLAHTNI